MAQGIILQIGCVLMSGGLSSRGKRVSFLRGDVTRAIKGAQAAGFDPGAVEICLSSGRIVILPKETDGQKSFDPIATWEAEQRARKA